MKYYHLVSLGCPKNLVDSEIFAGIIEHTGFSHTEDPAEAEVIIINTCGFILPAKQEAIDTILKAAQLKTEGKCKKLIATGCLVKRYFDDLKRDIPEIDQLIDLKDFSAFAKLFESDENHRKQLTPAHYAYLRIADGCNNHCSYCAIPAIRGILISLPIEEVVRQAKIIAESGVQELIVTAQDTTQYGMDLYGERKLLPLLKELEKIEQLKWIRLLYLHPAHLSNELIDHICQSEKICHYFEIPLQHINDTLLQSMNRHVTGKRTIEIIKRIREKDPLATIRTTFIVGYPGETDEMYNELVEFVEEFRFERMGVFAYSEEEDTPAALLDHKVDEDVAEIRQDQLMGMQMDISSEIMRRWLGETMMVIIDDKSEDEDFDFVCRSQYDCPDIDGIVYINGQAKPGEIRKVKIVATWEYDLVAKIID